MIGLGPSSAPAAVSRCLSTLAVAASLSLGLAAAVSATAATLRVDTESTACDDRTGSPFCHLAAALAAAEATDEPDTIVLVAGSTHTLAAIDHQAEGGNGLPAISTQVTIEGHGAAIERRDRPNVPRFRIFRIEPSGNLHLRDLTVRHGATEHGFDGAGLWNRGQLVLERCRVEDNRSLDDGGGLRNDGVLTILGSTFADNAAQGRGGVGGGLYNVAIAGPGEARIEGTTFYGNVAEMSGGAIWNEATLEATNSTWSGNRATQHGGAIHTFGHLTLTHCTLTGNRSALSGGAIRAHEPFVARATLIAGNRSPLGPSCIGGLRSEGSNLVATPQGCEIESGSGGGGGGGDLLGVDPRLGSLDDHGGPTLTHALAPASPARGAVGGDCPAEDQRGAPRRAGGGPCDIGAFELGESGEQTSPGSAGSF